MVASYTPAHLSNSDNPPIVSASKTSALVSQEIKEIEVSEEIKQIWRARDIYFQPIPRNTLPPEVNEGFFVSRRWHGQKSSEVVGRVHQANVSNGIFRFVD